MLKERMTFQEQIAQVKIQIVMSTKIQFSAERIVKQSSFAYSQAIHLESTSTHYELQRYVLN